VTLNTSIVIGQATPVREVFDFCRELIKTPGGTPFTQRDDSYSPGMREIFNPGGIGLCAWLWINYGADGPMIGAPDDPEDQEELDYIARTPTKNGWAAIEVTFDTAYGYTSPEGEGCSQLHARLVAELGKWLDRKGLPWKWQNEYTCEWHDGFDGLAEFVGAHKSSGADEWFRNTVLPVIRGGVS
jgi:hypothetical protein